MTLSCFCHLVPRGKRCLNCYINWRNAGGVVRPKPALVCDCGVVIRTEGETLCWQCRHETVKSA